MSNYTANVWDRGIDSNYRPCWIDKQNGQVTYQLLDSNGIPLPQNYGGNCGMGMGTGVPQMAAYPVPMQWGMGYTGCFTPQAAPACPPAATTVAIVGDKVKPDTWTEWEDDDGKKFYHNPSKPDETTYDKPEDFVKQQNAGKPAPPTAPKPKAAKYATNRKGWL